MGSQHDAYRRATAAARCQHGVISYFELLGLGIQPALVQHWCRTGLLERIAQQAYRIAGAPSTWRQELCVATLTTNGFASHRAAGALSELDGCASPPAMELVTHRWQRRARGGLILHEAKDLKPCDMTEIDGIASTNVVRTLLDLPAVVNPFVAGLALDDAWRKDPQILDQVLARFLEVARRGRNGTRVMRAMLEERLEIGIAPGSGFERRCERMLMNAGLPRPVRQHHVRDGSFDAWIDLSYPPIKFGIECDSLAHHSGKRAHEHDRERRRRLKMLGWDMVEVTYDDVTKRAANVGREVAELYHARLASLSSLPD